MGYYIQPEYSLEPDYDKMAQKIKQMLKQDKMEQAKDLINGCADDSIEIELEDLNMLKQLLFDTPSVDEDVKADDFDWHDLDDDPY